MDEPKPSPAPSSDELPLDVEMMKVLASDSRRDILRLLAKRRMTLTELATQLDLGKATVLEHLKRLTDVGLVRRMEDERLWVYYELTHRGGRLVNPGRTRFYLLMGAAATAAVVLVAAVAVAFLAASPPSLAPDARSDDAAGPPGKVVADASAEPLVLTAWRGTDDTVEIRLAPGVEGTLRLSALGVSPQHVAVQDGVARIEPAFVDALAPGVYALELQEAGAPGWSSTGRTLRVAEPFAAVSPLHLVQGRTSVLTVALALPGDEAPQNVTLLLDGVPVAHERPSPGVALVTVEPAAPGTLLLQVGRLPPTVLEVHPGVVLDAVPQGNLTFALRARAPSGAPLAGLDAALDEKPLGVTDDQGRFAFTAPQAGAYNLTLRRGGSDVDARRVVLDDASIREDEARLTLTATALGEPSRLVVDATPSGRPASPVTLVASVDGAFVASAPLSAGPTRLVAAGIPAGEHEVTVRAVPLDRFPLASSGITETSADASAGDQNTSVTPVPAPTATPAPAAPTVARYELDRDDVVRLRVNIPPMPGFRPLSPGAAEMAPTPAVPGPGLVLVALALLGAALATRRR